MQASSRPRVEASEGERMNVLEVMKDAAAALRNGEYPGTSQELMEARAAVAELIEAASEVDRLSRDFSVWDDPESVERAVLRQRAALARVGGGK